MIEEKKPVRLEEDLLHSCTYLSINMGNIVMSTFLQYGIRVLLKSECRRKKCIVYLVFSVSAETPESSSCCNINFYFVQSYVTLLTPLCRWSCIHNNDWIIQSFTVINCGWYQNTFSARCLLLSIPIALNSRIPNIYNSFRSYQKGV